MADPELRAQLTTRGTEVAPGTPEELTQHITSNIRLWSDAVKRSGVRARGATVRQLMETTSQMTALPEAARALVADADFIVFTWFCSILNPFFIAQRAGGQRWVKITYFRDIDLLHPPQAGFPAELVGDIIRATASRLPAGKDFNLKFADRRGTNFSIGLHHAELGRTTHPHGSGVP